MITAFGVELRQRRERARMSRYQLKRLSGVSESQIGNIETQGAAPGRPTVIDLARSFPRWDVDTALELAGHEPLSDDERAELAEFNSPREQLDRLLDELPEGVLAGLLALVRSLLNPNTTNPIVGTQDSAPDTHYLGTEDLGEEPTEHEPTAEERGATSPAPNGPANGPAPR